MKLWTLLLFSLVLFGEEKTSCKSTENILSKKFYYWRNVLKADNIKSVQMAAGEGRHVPQNDTIEVSSPASCTGFGKVWDREIIHCLIHAKIRAIYPHLENDQAPDEVEEQIVISLTQTFIDSQKSNPIPTAIASR